MTHQEKAYLRAISANKPIYAKGIAEEWSVGPLYHYAHGLGWGMRVCSPQVEAFLKSITKEWGWKWQG